jgi:hypothetical protein
MNPIESIVREEYERQKSLIELWLAQANKLPKGSISCKSIKGQEYAYLNKWENKKAVKTYLGLYTDDKVKALQSQIKTRQDLSQKIKQAKLLIKKLEKGIRATD